MRKLNILGTVILGIGTLALGVHLLFKLGFQKVIVPNWGVAIINLFIIAGCSINMFCNIKQIKEHKNS